MITESTELTAQIVWDLLNSAEAMTVDDGPVLTDWTLEAPTGDADDILLEVSWELSHGTVEMHFDQGQLVESEVCGNYLHMKNANGEVCRIMLFKMQSLIETPTVPLPPYES